MINSKNSQQITKLPATLSLFSLVVFGVGDMLGAGIYALTGIVAGMLGNMAWAGFCVSLFAAMLTGLSYANIGARHPKAAGASYVTERAFGLPFLAYLVGLAVLASGVTSMAAASWAFTEYSRPITENIPGLAVVLFFLAFLAFIVFRGMKESTSMNLVCTAIEAGGLVLIIIVGMKYIGSVDLFDATSVSNPTGSLTALLLLQGAAVTFYAFMGFEDMLNVSEEVKDAERNFPIGVVIALLITSVIYMLVVIIAVSVVPHAELASSSGKMGPLVRVVEVAAPWMNTGLFSLISLFAIANTALLNFVMASRLTFGMSQQGLLPAFLSKLHTVRKTPHLAVLTILALAGALTLVGKLSDLAAATSMLILFVFIIINAALIRLKLDVNEKRSGFEVPLVVPCLAILVSASVIVARLMSGDYRAVYIAGALIVGISLLYFFSGFFSKRSSINN